MLDQPSLPVFERYGKEDEGTMYREIREGEEAPGP
jgi:hypothetical protein